MNSSVDWKRWVFLFVLAVEGNCYVLNRDYSMYLFTSKGFYCFHTHILCWFEHPESKAMHVLVLCKLKGRFSQGFPAPVMAPGSAHKKKVIQKTSDV